MTKALPGFIPGRAFNFYSAFNLHPTGQGEHDPVLGIHCHAVDQRGPQALVKLGDELWQVLHALDEPLDLPAADHDLVNLLDVGIALMLGFLIPGNQCIVALVVFLTVYWKKSLDSASSIYYN